MAEYQAGWKELMLETLFGIRPDAQGTWFVERSEALVPILQGLTAKQASYRANDSVSSVAAHVIHATYYIQVGLNNATGEEVKADWAGSWAEQQVDEPRWHEVRTELEQKATELIRVLDTNPPTEQEDITYQLAQLSHAAFHLGSLRQLSLLAKTSS